MAKKTDKNPRGAGRKTKPDAEKTISFTITARRPVVSAITEIAKRRGLTRGQFIQRLLETEASKHDSEGARGRALGEIYAIATEIAKLVGAEKTVAVMRDAAINQPAAVFPAILEFCAREIPHLTLANGRNVLKTRIADLTVSLGFAFPETLTEAEREAFEKAVEKHNKI